VNPDETDPSAQHGEHDPGHTLGSAGPAPTGDGSPPSARTDAPAAVDRPGEEVPTSDVAPLLPALLEALLLVTDEPVTVPALAAVAGSDAVAVEQTLLRLASDYEEQRRGFELRCVSGGWRLYTRSDCAPYVERFLLDGQSARLTQAALETLAVIAYRQPVTRGRVSAVRGVNVDGVVRSLHARGLISEAGQDADSSGTLFRTTPLFLERLGLRSLDDLPALAPLLPELDELDDASTST